MQNTINEREENVPAVIIKKTVLGYEITSKQNAYLNYLVPSVLSCILYILLFTTDLATAYRHFEEDNPIWATLTILFMYMPVVGCFIITVSSYELWPEYDGCSNNNIFWFIFKFLQHLFFPIWSMWR